MKHKTEIIQGYNGVYVAVVWGSLCDGLICIALNGGEMTILSVGQAFDLLGSLGEALRRLFMENTR